MRLSPYIQGNRPRCAANPIGTRWIGLSARGYGIHGTDNPILNIGNINWTTGCISIDNSDIVELARLLPIGTLVIIKP